MPTTGGVTALPPEVQDELAEIDQAKAAAESAKVSAIDTRTMILNDRARQAVTVAQTTESITTLEGAIAALNALSASYEAALPASLADRQALHDRDAAFTVMVADMTAKLERIQALDASQSSELEAQRKELQTMLGQVQSFLPTRDALTALAGRVSALELRCKALEDARVELDHQVKTLPAIAIGGTLEQTFVWRKPFSAADYQLRINVTDTGNLLNLATVTTLVKAQTAQSLTLTVKVSGVKLGAGAFLDVVAFRESLG